MINYFNGYILFPLLELLSKREILPKLNQLKAFEIQPIDIRHVEQREELYKLLVHCQKNIPYYKELFNDLAFEPEKVKEDIYYLKKLPVLTKKTIKENAGKLKFKQGGYLHPRKTGGSTGESVFFYYDRKGLDWTSAINLFAYEMARKKPHHSDCHISADLDLNPPPLKHRAKDWIKLLSQNRKRLLVSSFAPIELKKAYKDLKRMRPYLLQGHPSSLYAISSYIENNKLSPIKLCHIFEPSGEMLTQKMVESIEKNIQCKVVNRYGNAEFGVIAHSKFNDNYTKLKVFDRAFFVEECKDSNIIVTGLTNYGFPLLRYDTGDIGTVKEEEDGHYIYNIQGRVHDLVRIGSEEFPTHYIMDFLDHKVKDIREFQILLTNDDQRPLLNIVLEKDTEEERVKNEIKSKWGNDMRLEFIPYESLIRQGWRQKFRHLIDLRKSV